MEGYLSSGTTEPPPLYQPGDIVGMLPRGFWTKLATWASYRLISPPTRLFHFLVIGREISSEDDYEILESIGKGVALGRLNFYTDVPYVVFRVVGTDTQKNGYKALLKASKLGRRKYDYFLLVKLSVAVLRLWLRQIHRFQYPHRIAVADIPYARDDRFICTELANEIWRAVGFPVVPAGQLAIPAAFIQALMAGKLQIVSWNRRIEIGDRWWADDQKGIHLE